MKLKIKKIIEQVCNVKVTNDLELIEDNVLTSLEIISLISNLEDEFNIEIEVSDLLPQNFKNITAIEKMIKKKLNK